MGKSKNGPSLWKISLKTMKAKKFVTMLFCCKTEWVNKEKKESFCHRRKEEDLCETEKDLKRDEDILT